MTDLSKLSLDELLDCIAFSSVPKAAAPYVAEIRRRFAALTESISELEQYGREAVEELATELADERTLHNATIARVVVLENALREIESAVDAVERLRRIARAALAVRAEETSE